jgi:UDP-N-acetyl-D-glucosamine dehydrogenase
MVRYSVNNFKKKIQQKKIKISVVGLGYVGLPIALAFAKKGFTVFGVEIDKDRLINLKNKEAYITDVSSEELKKALDSGRLIPYGDFKALKDVDVVIICVPTPLKKRDQPNISFIKRAVISVAKNLKRGSLVILESTTYPGTTEEVILPLLEKNGLRHGEDFYLCFSPERIDPGNSRYTLSRIPKVVGGIDNQATLLGKVLYEAIINKVVVVSSTRVAEITKLLENTFRIVNIGLVDELAMMAHKMGIDIWEAIAAASTKPFGFMPFYPGPGVGGHCIPKDPLYLYWKAKKFGFNSKFIKLASKLINFMPEYIVKRIKFLLKLKGIKIEQAKILILGVTYKKDVRDLRKSPALDIINLLKKEKAKVYYYDPFIPYLKFLRFNLKSIDIKKADLSFFDCVAVITDHSKVDYQLILKKSRLIFDARNIYIGKKNDKVIKL